jgi:major vault protein
MSKNSIKIPPFYYIHVLDQNINVTRLEIGPQTFIRQDHEKISSGDRPLKMIVLLPRTYCEVTNPVIRNEKNALTFDKYGQVNVKHGETEYRFFEKYPEPFPLYPKEELTLVPKDLTIVKELKALRLEALRNFVDSKGVERNAGDEYLFEGPNTYYPRIEEKVTSVVSAQTIRELQALKLRAKQALVDRKGVKRQAGEEWLEREKGAYLPGVYEEVIELQNPFILNNTRAISLRATKNFIDEYKKERKAGEEWLVTIQDSSYHILDIFEEFVSIVNITVLDSKQYCIVLNPIDPKNGKNRLGARELRKGEATFFLQPGEELEGGIKNIYLLEENQALLLRAKEKIDDHNPGDKWMVFGPCSYIPPVEVEVLETREIIPLDKNEGLLMPLLCVIINIIT